MQVDDGLHLHLAVPAHGGTSVLRPLPFAALGLVVVLAARCHILDFRTIAHGIVCDAAIDAHHGSAGDALQSAERGEDDTSGQQIAAQPGFLMLDHMAVERSAARVVVGYQWLALLSLP